MHAKRTNLAAALVLVVLAAVGLGAPALADGSASYPSTAPTIVSGQSVSGGVDKTSISCFDSYNCSGSAGVQYYRLTMALGDRLGIDFQSLAASPSEVCVMSPSVTDFTVADADCLASASTAANKFGRLDYEVGQSGTYLVAIVASYSNSSWGYKMTPYVATRVTPTIALAGAKSAKVGHKTRLRGVISPAIGTKVLLRSKSPAHGWINAGKAKTNADGSFSFSYYLGHRGPHKFQVFFAGAGFYNPAASQVVKVKVH